MWGLKDNAAFFYAPADVARKGVPLERNVRIGGMVKQGSIRREPDGVTIRFIVGDETPATIPVRFRGIAPDLFKENSGVVAEGRFQPDGLFVADEILAKHDENYMPPELSRDGSKHKTETLK
jgi:cytochrome c-type biogenesis protein CcmE